MSRRAESSLTAVRRGNRAKLEKRSLNQLAIVRQKAGKGEGVAAIGSSIANRYPSRQCWLAVLCPATLHSLVHGGGQ